MNKFNEVAQTVLKEEKHDYFHQISDILTSYGMKAYEMEPLMKIVQKAITLSFNEGYKAGSTNPFIKH
jgi:hypothetical protein